MRAVLLAAAVFGAACASSGSAPVQQAGDRAAARANGRCAPIVSDSLLGGAEVFPACGVSREAKLASPALRPQYTPGAGQRCAAARVDIVVDANGNPVMSTARVVRATDPTLATAILSALSGAKYDPAIKDGARVAQIVEVEWSMSVNVRAVGSPSSASSRRASAPRC